MPQQQITPGKNLNPTARFSNRVSYYVRSRPGYPDALLRFCIDRLGLQSNDAIADIGSGTGILSQIFLDHGNAVYAIEPNAPMREAAEELLRDRPNFHSVCGTAEATTLLPATVKFVVAGQAFHWFDPPKARAEFKRILLPGGWVVLVWNERRIGVGDFSEVYEKVIRTFEIDLHSVHHASMTAQESETLAQFFVPGNFESVSFPNIQHLDLAGVEGRALSSSYLPLPGQKGCDEMLAALREAFDQHQQGGSIQFGYDTKVYFGQLI
jgi:SAM-dependent methyltransferase